jgi:hypothetical protein
MSDRVEARSRQAFALSLAHSFADRVPLAEALLATVQGAGAEMEAA